MKLYQELNIRESRSSKGMHEVYNGKKRLTSAVSLKEAISMMERLNKIEKFR